jgi:quercetin dioxygenase-like cupin family protein
MQDQARLVFNASELRGFAMSFTTNKNVLIIFGAPALFLLGAATATALSPSATFTPRLETTKTITGQPIIYPTGASAKITAGEVDLPPGGATGWHKHTTPVVGMILEGELTVDYGSKGKRTFKKGDAFVESINDIHQGTNTGSGTLRIYVVFVGAEGVPTSIPEKGP